MALHYFHIFLTETRLWTQSGPIILIWSPSVGKPSARYAKCCICARLHASKLSLFQCRVLRFESHALVRVRATHFLVSHTVHSLGYCGELTNWQFRSEAPSGKVQFSALR